MYYGEIKKCDIANGPGVRVSLFVSGCTHHCKGCFNEETWSFEYGKPFTEETEEQILKLLEPSYISGLTVLGGEPMEYMNQEVLFPFLKKVKERFPEKSIWCFTGYVYEKDILHRMIPKWKYTKKMLEQNCGDTCGKHNPGMESRGKRRRSHIGKTVWQSKGVMRTELK